MTRRRRGPGRRWPRGAEGSVGGEGAASGNSLDGGQWQFLQEGGPRQVGGEKKFPGDLESADSWRTSSPPHFHGCRWAGGAHIPVYSIGLQSCTSSCLLGTSCGKPSQGWQGQPGPLTTLNFTGSRACALQARGPGVGQHLSMWEEARENGHDADILLKAHPHALCLAGSTPVFLPPPHQPPRLQATDPESFSAQVIGLLQSQLPSLIGALGGGGVLNLSLGPGLPWEFYKSERPSSWKRHILHDFLCGFRGSPGPLKLCPPGGNVCCRAVSVHMGEDS